MKLLVLEDNSEKAKGIRQGLEETFSDEIAVDLAPDAVSAKRCLAQERYDILILDLCIPTRYGDAPAHNGGVLFLEEVSQIKRIHVPEYIVGLTQFEEAERQSTAAFRQQCWTIQRYDPTSSSWLSTISNLVQYVRRKKIQDTSTLNYSNYAAVITALHNPEFTALLGLPREWKPIQLANDRTDCWYYSFLPPEGDGGERRVIVATASKAGNTHTAILATKMIDHFRPQILLMCGITAAFSTRADIGDILLAEETWDYASGKHCEDPSGECRFAPDGLHYNADPDLLSIGRTVGNRGKYVETLYAEWLGRRPSNKPCIKVCQVVSGPSVVASAEIHKTIEDQGRKVTGIEMETFGLYAAAHAAAPPRPKVLSVKAVCDHADTTKGDDFQDYAAYLSARLSLSLLESEYLILG